MSLLVCYEECQHAYDWIVGIHGIIISFTTNGRHYNATYLPEVSKQQGWTQQEAIESLVRKAGWNGRIQEPIIQSIKCTRYQSSKEHMVYEEYVRRLKYETATTALSELSGKKKGFRSQIIRFTTRAIYMLLLSTLYRPR